MKKIKMLAITAFTAIGAFIIITSLLKRPNISAKIFSKQAGKVLGRTTKGLYKSAQKQVKNESEKLISEQQNTIQNTLQQYSQKLQTVVEKTADSARKQINNSETQIIVSNNVESPIAKDSIDQNKPQIYNIDFLKKEIRFIQANRGIPLYIRPVNVPYGYCLFLGPQKKQVKTNKIISITINAAGKYPLYFDYCSSTLKQRGLVVIQ